MARKCRLTYTATLMLLLITWKEGTYCNGLTVSPPENLVITDPGHLGQLEITWNPPDSLPNVTECSVRYQLEYYNTYQDSWASIRTSKRTYTAQFDLMKDVRVRIYTLLSGTCTNDTMIKSTNYTEVIQKPPSTGVLGTEVLDFKCVFHNREYTECQWRRSEKIPDNSLQKLYFWHKELGQAEECPKYNTLGGVTIGCTFADVPLPVFTDINFCLNGSSPEGPLKPTFASLQIQNHVKCAATKKLHLQTGPDKFELHWEHPDGKVPGHCLEYEVEHNQEGPDGKESSTKSLTGGRTSLSLSIDINKTHCFRVRSKVHKYCASTSYWSDWSHSVCQPEQKDVTPEPDAIWDAIPVYIYIAVGIIALLVLSLCAWAMFKLKKPVQEKKVESLLTSLFARRPLLGPTEA